MKLSIRNILEANKQLGGRKEDIEQVIKLAKRLQLGETINIKTGEIEFNPLAADLKENDD